MRVFRFSPYALIAFVSPVAAVAQIAPAPAPGLMVQPLNPDADELSADIRLLAVNPHDVQTLIRAGELTLKLDDSTAAAAFFARAERIDPRNPRIKAGLGSLLVQAEKPGEALRRFAEAESLGLEPQRFAADRGLAYDLIGEQERAQRDYRLALKGGANDETLRRYALSLGISGKPDLAYRQIEPLLRRSDRGAWRDRAFILAMTGDVAGAERIAVNMMPPGLSQGLQPFFERLPALAPVDRAFAVHFGELRPTPERIADSRMIPALAALPPDPNPPAPIMIAQNDAKADRPDDRRNRKRRKGRDEAEIAGAPPPAPLPQPPVYTASVQPAYSPSVRPVYGVPAQPGYGATVQPGAVDPTAYSRPVRPPYATAASPVITPTDAARPTIIPAPPRPAAAPTPAPALAPIPQVQVAAQPQRTVPQSTPVIVTPSAPSRPQPAPLSSAISPAAAAQPAPSLGSAPQPRPAPVVSPPTTPVQSAPVRTVPVEANTRLPAAAATPVQITPAPPAIPVATAAPARPLPAPLPTEAGPAPLPAGAGPAPPPPVAIASVTPTPPRSEDAIIANIIAGVAGPDASAEPARLEAPVAAVPIAVAPVTPTAVPADLAAAEKASADRIAAADKKSADDKKAVDEKKAADARKLADAKKLADARKAAELKKKNDPKILEPERIWVQVAGGANESTLPKEWARVREKEPAAFKGKTGWTTPLRATNRVLAGPFKTEEEARAFVNALAKGGLSAFTFTSEAGQKITKLPGK